MPTSNLLSFALPRWLKWSLSGGSLLLAASCGSRASIATDAPTTGVDAPTTHAGSGAVASAGTAGYAGTDAGGSPAASGAGSAEAGGSAAGGGAGGSAGLAGAGSVQLSCAELAATCGPSGNESCCASRAVPGGTFDRQQNGEHFPATVSDFVLDKYEVTVGRFRKFVAAYSRNMILPGAGKNPNNPADPGWDPTWNAHLDADATALKAALECDENQTWTDTPGNASAESLPIACISWFEAEAFCTWDDGRLPTDAEWTYVASAGAEQRLYPWGNAAPDCTFANFIGAPGADFCVQPGVGAANSVGSESPKGDSKWGHADMAGNLDEWTQDYSQRFSSPCHDCANLTPNATSRRLIKGGSFSDNAGALSSAFRSSAPPGVAVSLFGARCARRAPDSAAKRE